MTERRALSLKVLLSRSAIVAVGWAGATQAFGLLADRQGHLVAPALGSVLSTFFLALVLGYAGSHLPWRQHHRFAALLCVVFAVKWFSPCIELLVFSSRPLHLVLAMAAFGFAESVVLAWVSTIVFPHLVTGSTPISDLRALFATRTLASWTWRFFVSDLAYVGTYMLFGSIAFLFTRPYYTDPSYGLDLKLPSSALFLVEIQVARALIYIIVLLPIVAGLNLDAKRKAVLAGMILWVAGGLAPLLSNTTWPLALRVYHIVEIFSQNVTSGVIMAVLLSRACSFGGDTGSDSPCRLSANS